MFINNILYIFQCDLREEVLVDNFIVALSEISIPEHIIAWTKAALTESHKEEQDYHQNHMRLLQDRYRTTQRKINSAYEYKLEGRVDLDFWQIQNDRLNKELVETEAQVASLRAANASYIEQGVQLMELARTAPTLFKSMTPDEKRELVNLVLSNPRIENGSLRYDYKKPFSMFVGVTDLEKWRAGPRRNEHLSSPNLQIHIPLR